MKKTSPRRMRAVRPCAPSRLLRLGLLAGAIGGACAAQAEEAGATPPAPITQAPPHTVDVRGSASAYDPRRDDTASKIVVTHDELTKYGDTGIAEALKRVPGVTVNGSGRGAEIRMRGLGNGYTQILIDGQRAPANFTIDSLSPDVIERIEVLRVASAEFSTQSIAGTINIVLKKAVKAGQRTAKLGYAHGEALVSPNASLQLSDKLGKLSYSLAASYSRTRSEQDPRTVEQSRDPAGQLVGTRLSREPETDRITLANLTPRINWTFDNGDTLSAQTFLNFAQYEEYSSASVDAVLGPLPAFPLFDQARKTTFRTAREELNWIHKFGGGVKLDAKIGGNLGHITEWRYRTGSGNPAVPALHQTNPAEGDDHGLTTMGKLSSSAWEGHTLAAGWDAGRNRRSAWRLDRDTLAPEVELSPDERYSATLSRFAFYAQDDWVVSKQWSLYLGARWEGILVRTEGNTFPPANTRSTVWSPLFQSLYKLPGHQGDQLRFAVSRTYKSPELQSLLPLRFNSGNNTPANPDTTGNPNLKPELALGFDAAWEHYWAEGALLTASVSERRIDDVARQVIDFQDGRWIAFQANGGRARTRGLELEAKFPLKALMQTAMALDLRASLSRNWSTVDAVPGPDNRLAAQTPLSATLGADYMRGPLALGASFVFKNGGRVQVLANQASFQSVRRDLDLYASWQFDPRLQLRVAAANLLAQDRVSASDFLFPDLGSESARTLTPSHRSVRATLQLKF